MRDFSTVQNSVGSFPNCSAVDCSGPGETDGTASIAQTTSDYWGAIQALMSEAGLTPNGSAESASGTSQILNAIKVVIRNALTLPKVPLTSGFPNGVSGSRSWRMNYVAGANLSLMSEQDSGYIAFALRLPQGFAGETITVTVTVNPGTARSSGDRMRVLFERHTSGSLTTVDSAYDDGTTNTQTIEVTDDITSDTGQDYYIVVKAGNTGGSQVDSISKIAVAIS